MAYTLTDILGSDPTAIPAATCSRANAFQPSCHTAPDSLDITWRNVHVGASDDTGRP